MEALWFLIGVVIGLALDIPLVKYLLKPINKRLEKLETRADSGKDIVERLRYMEENGI